MKHYTESQVLATARFALKTISQRELAETLDYPESNLSAILSGKRPLNAALARKLGFERMETLYTRTPAQGGK